MRVHRKPLAVLTAEVLEAGIKKGTWVSPLPGENPLSRQLGVSRSTLRAALALLRRSGVLATSAGLRATLATKRKAPRGQHVAPTVNVLLPVPFEQLPNFAIFWMDELRAQLHSAGRALNLVVSRAFYRERNGPARERLIAQQLAGPWILAFSKPDIQHWFQEQKIPTVVSGLTAPGIHLPCVAVDSYAVMFHMLGGLTARGHRRIALLTGHASSTMPLIFLRPFEDTCRRIGTDKIEPEVISLLEETPETVGRELMKSLRRKNGPTALVIFNPLNAVAAFSYLPAHGVSIPRDVSIVTTFGDSYLDHLSPAPCRYHYHARIFATRLFETVQKLDLGFSSQDLQIKIMLEPVEGKSVGPPRSRPLPG